MHHTVRIAATAALVFAGAAGAYAQNTAPKSQDAGPVLKGKAALGDWKQDKPGLRRLLTVADQPPIGKDVKNFSEKAPMPEGASPRIPPGFTIEMVASGLKTPRVIRTAPNGDLFVAEKESNSVRVLRVPSGAARPEINEVFASGLSQPYGIAFYPSGANPESIYVANADGVVRFRYKSGDIKASGEPEQIVKRIPWAHHWTRDIAFTPDGKTAATSVGSGSNVALDMFPTPLTGRPGGVDKTQAARRRVGYRGTARRSSCPSIRTARTSRSSRPAYATAPALTIHPTTGELWCVVNERDELGDNTPFEYATEVKEGAFYGWPWYYLGGHEDPRQKGARPDLEGQGDRARRADAGALGAAAASRSIEGDSFPADYKGERLRRPCTARGTARSAPATRWCACCSTAPASRPANTRTSSPASWSTTRRCGAAPSASRSRRTARCS